jgi:hypothetical protein
MKFKVWHIPQIPMKPFEVDVKDIDEASLIINTLANYDLFQYENKVKPDYSNMSGLKIFDGEINEWIEWCGYDFDLDCEDIHDYMNSKEEN